MKTKQILIFLLTIVQTSWAQNYDFEIRNLSNNLNGKTEIIDKSEYEKVKVISEEFIEFNLITEQNLIKKYPEIFKLKDSCYNFSETQKRR